MDRFPNHISGMDDFQNLIQIAVVWVNCHCVFPSSNPITIGSAHQPVVRLDLIVFLIDGTNAMMELLDLLIQDKSKLGSVVLSIELFKLAFHFFELF